MEKESSGRGFQIANGKIPILLALKRIPDLKPHEETVENDLKAIIASLESDPFLRHPIIADSKTGAVLDGTHRLAALSRMGCLTIPAALIDYQNPLVQVERWFRTIRGNSLDVFTKRVEDLNPTLMSYSTAEKSLQSRQCYATLRNAKDCVGFPSQKSDPLELCRGAFQLEQIARDAQMKISYTDVNDISKVLGGSFVMSTIRLEKKEVVSSCLKGTLFPPKSTRHLIPSRPLGISFPLSGLKENNIREAEMQFERHLRAKTMRRLPEGSLVGSRRYMEEVFLFE